MEKLKLKVKKVHPDAKLPTKAYSDDTGWDLYAIEDVVIHPIGYLDETFEGSITETKNSFTKGLANCIGEIRIGLMFQPPKGYWLRAANRSSYAKKGLIIHPSIIDSGFRFEYSIWMINLSGQNIVIHKGDKVAQLILEKLNECEVEEVEELDKSERGENRHGSSGR